MSTLRTSALSLLLILTAACRGPSTTPSGMHIGGDIQVRQSVRFALVDAQPHKFFDQTLLVEASVQAVCQKKGCWMQITDEGHTAMVRWESGCGGQFAFPTDAVGKRVLIQGSFYRTTISEDDAKHMEEEAGRKLELAREGYEFNASAVVVLDDRKQSAPR